jgi:hypothetical protein
MLPRCIFPTAVCCIFLSSIRKKWNYTDTANLWLSAVAVYIYHSSDPAVSLGVTRQDERMGEKERGRDIRKREREREGWGGKNKNSLYHSF